MGQRRAAFLLPGLALLAYLGPAWASAPASQTIGQVQVSAAGTSNGTVVQHTSDPAGPSYVVPAGGGVITSWSIYADTSGTAKLKLFTLTDATYPYGYHVDSESSLATLTAGATNTFMTRLPVAGGERLGLFAAGPLSYTYTGSGTQIAAFGASPGYDAPVGSDQTATGSQSPAQLNVSAVLEADADGDGYGDETQDLCFTDPSTQAPCPTPTISGVVRVGQTLTATPHGHPVSPSYQWLTCNSGGSGCSPIAGATGTSYTVRATDVGNTLRFRKTATDASGMQTASSAATAVVRPALPMLVFTRSPHVTSDGAGVAFSVKCQVAACVGNATDTLTEKLASGKIVGIAAAHRRHVKVGIAHFSVAPGVTKTVTIRLNRLGRRLLARFQKLPLRVTIKLVNAGGEETTVKTVRLTLKRKQRHQNH